jgi:LAO/AO transport system kinase
MARKAVIAVLSLMLSGGNGVGRMPGGAMLSRVGPRASAVADDIAALVERIARRHIRTISRSISEIENDTGRAAEIISAVDAMSGKALIVGVTGVPGGGKSTLVPALAKRFAASGKRPAILAVDPSSPLTGGAILGDRIRDTGESDIFFRSVASRGSLGGLSKTLDDVVTLLDAAGFDVILIETVGTGQSEIGVTRLAHTTLLLTAPGLGDEIQAMKAGILETADVIVVNKADVDPRGAEATRDTIRNALDLSLRAHGLSEGVNAATAERQATWHAPVRMVSALKGDGLDELIKMVVGHREFLATTTGLDDWRRQRRLERFHEAMRDALTARVRSVHGAALQQLEEAVASGRANPVGAASDLARNCVALLQEVNR